MSFTVPLALYGWPFVVFAMFLSLKPRTVVVASFIGAWLFLPMAGYNFPGFGEWTKTTATTATVLLAVSIFDAGRLIAFRPQWFDLPMLVWCLVPFATSLANDLGAYDGASMTLRQGLTWGVPYLIGRLYFADPEGIRVLAVGIFVGGLLYVPLCLYEIRMSPQLHRTVYGYHQHSFESAIRFGGFRPTVFMQHGLAVGMWMTTTTLVGVWLWSSGAVRRLGGIPAGWLVGVLLVTTILCKSMMAVLLLVAGLGTLYATRIFRTSVPYLSLLAFPPIYMLVRSTGRWSADVLVAMAEIMGGGERTYSLRHRLASERGLVQHAWDQPILGWGGWNRAIPQGDAGWVDGFRIITDAQWTLAFGMHGLVGLISLNVVLLLPAFLLWRRQPIKSWAHPGAAAAVALAMVLIVYSIDNLMNAMQNPIYLLAAGGLAAYRPSAGKPRRPPRKTTSAGERRVPRDLGSPVGVG